MAATLQKYHPQVFVRFSEKLPEGWLSNPDLMLPQTQMDSLWDFALELSQEPTLGLLMSQEARTHSFGLLGYIVAHSESLQQVYEHALRYQSLTQEGAGRWQLSEGKNYWELSFSLLPPVSRCAAQIREFVVGTWLGLGAALVAESSVVTEVYFEHAPQTDPERYQQLLGVPCHFEQSETRFRLARSLLGRPNRLADSHLLPILQSAAEPRISWPQEESYQSKVEVILKRQLRQGVSTLQQVAEALQLSDRTLRRRLQEEQVRFQECLDQVRYELCLNYLEAGRMAVWDIALVLGFQDTRGLYRAFQRWHGQSLSEYRKLGK